VAAGLVCVLLGMTHFLDRDRPVQARRHYYLGVPGTVAGRAVLATGEVVVGFALLFTA
jgi:hypothetical protein